MRALIAILAAVVLAGFLVACTDYVPEDDVNGTSAGVLNVTPSNDTRDVAAERTVDITARDARANGTAAANGTGDSARNATGGNATAPRADLSWVDCGETGPNLNCGKEYVPVCGDNNVTYVNSCVACTRVDRYAEGDCEEI